MIFKTTKEISDDFENFKITANTVWVGRDEIITEIKKHENCKEYHYLGNMKFTCLDVILGKLNGFFIQDLSCPHTDELVSKQSNPVGVSAKKEEDNRVAETEVTKNTVEVVSSIAKCSVNPKASSEDTSFYEQFPNFKQSCVSWTIDENNEPVFKNGEGKIISSPIDCLAKIDVMKYCLDKERVRKILVSLLGEPTIKVNIVGNSELQSLGVNTKCEITHKYYISDDKIREVIKELNL